MSSENEFVSWLSVLSLQQRDPAGHWDVKTGNKGETIRVLPDGTRVDHNNNPLPRISISQGALRTAAKVGFWGTVAAIGAQVIRTLGPILEEVP